MRQHEIVRLRHFAGDFRVATFVGIEQRIPTEVEAEREDGGEQQQRQPHVRAERERARNRGPAEKRSVQSKEASARP